MPRKAPLALALLLAGAAWTALTPAATAFPLDYSDPSSDVVRLNATTGLCVVDLDGNCLSSPNPKEVNIQWLRGREAGDLYNLSIQVQGEIRDAPNTTYSVNLYADATNTTHWTVNYTDGMMTLTANTTGTPQNLTGNATIWGSNPAKPNTLSLFVNKTLLGDPGNLSADPNIDATAVMHGDPALGQEYSYQDFGWEVPGHPGSSPTLLRGHVTDAVSGAPIEGASVAVAGGGTVLTDATGFYEMPVVAGNVTVNYSADGYHAGTLTLTVNLGEVLTQDVGLTPDTTPPPGKDTPAASFALLALSVALVGGLLVWYRRREAA